MIVDSKENLSKMAFGFVNDNIEADLELDEKSLIDAVDRYLQANYYELYKKDSLGVIFKKAKEDKEVKQKMFNAIWKFIIH